MVDEDLARPTGRLLRRHRDFRLLWVGSTVGKLGDAVTEIALPLVAVSTLGATPFQVGLLSAAGWVAWLLIGLPVGTWVDRWRRRPVMVISSAASFVILVSVPVAAGLHVLSIGLLLVVALLAGGAAVFFQTSYGAYLPTILRPADRPSGNSLLEGSTYTASIAGQGAGGLIAQLAGAVNGLLADAVTFLVAIACTLGIRQPEQPPQRPDEPTTMVADIRGGMTFVFRDEWLRPMILFGTVANFALVGYQAIQVVFLVRTVGLSAGAVGGLVALTTVGGIIGALVAGRVGGWLGTARAQLAFIATTVTVLLLPLTFGGAGVLLFVVGGFGVSLGVAGSNVIVATFAQNHVPQNLLGRVIACTSFLSYGAIPLGALVGGTLAGALGPRGGLWVLTALVPLAGLFLLLSPVRTVRDLPLPPVPDAQADAEPEPEAQPG